MALDAEFKAKWVKALRSGRYEQTKGLLHNAGGYYCLGVGARVAGASVSALEHDETRMGMKWLARYGVESDHANNLALMNDTGASFAEIADCIEHLFGSQEPS